MKTIKIDLSTNSHSTGRGIGFYVDNLKKALETIPEIKLTDHKPDIIHYPYFDLFYPTLKIGQLPTVVTIHDLTPLVLSNLYPKGIRGRINLFRQKYALRKASAIITDSQNSKNDIIKFLNIPAEKIHVTPLAPNTNPTPTESQLKKIKQKYSLPKQYILYVGGVNPNKNLPNLVQACLDLNLNLVLVGSEFTKPLPDKQHPELKDLYIVKQALNQHPNQIYALGFVPGEDIVGIYKQATVYCQPSLYEGFGLPLLEAMSAGCLIVSSHTSSLPEIYPQNTINFDPENQQSLNQALNKAVNLTTKQRQKYIDAGKLKSKEFTWDKTAKLTAQVYRSLL